MNASTSPLFGRTTPGLAIAAAILLAAAGCGGGGGGGGGGAAESAAPPAAAPPAPLTRFAAFVAPAGFDWNTAQAAAGGISLSRASGAVLGDSVRLSISTATCTHPAVGDLANPMAVDSLTVHAVGNEAATLRTLSVPVSSIRVASVVNEVLVEVVEGNSTLYGKRHSLSALANLSVVFPDSPPAPDDTRFVDQCR